MRSITAKLATGLLFIVSSVLLAFGFYDYQQTEKRLHQELGRDIEIVTTRMQTSLPAPLWNFETEILNQILYSEIEEVFISGIQVINDSNEPTAGIFVDNGKTKLESRFQVIHSFVEKSSLSFDEDGEENFVGTLKLFINDEYISVILRENLERIMLQIIVIDLIILLLFSFALRPIVGPLRKLTMVASKIAKGDYSEEVLRQSRDEVGDLSENFNTMRITIQKKMSDLANINTIGEQLTLTYARNEAIKIVLDSINKHSRFQRGSIFLNDADTDNYTLRGYFPESEERSEPRHFAYSEGIVGVAVESREIVFVEDTQKDKRFVSKDSEKGYALLCVPMIDGQNVIGVINFSGSCEEVNYDDEDDEFMTSIARSLVITLKNIEMREEIEEYNRTLEAKVQERTAALQSKTNDISAMMKNLQQGLFTILNDQSIHHEYSKHLEKIFQTEKIAKQPFMDLLFSGAEMNADETDQIKASVSSLIGSDQMMWEFNVHNLPNEIIKTDADEKRVFEIDWNPIIADEEIEKIMVTVRDVTELRALQLEALEQKKGLEIISQILGLDSNKFFDFVESSKGFISKNRELIRSVDDYSDEVVQVLFRNMHTIKGNARTYQLSYITESVHLAETRYDGLRRSDTPIWDQQLLLEELSNVESDLSTYIQTAKETLGMDQNSGVTSNLSTENIEQIINTLRELHNTEGIQPDTKESINVHLNTLLSCINDSLEDTIHDVVRSLPSLAKAVNKPAPDIKIQCLAIYLNKQAKNMLNDVLMHCLRNSIDHGIEAPEERKQANKPEQGCIILTTKSEGEFLTLSISDDGKGLALGKIRQRAIDNGLLSEDETISNEDIAELVFHSGLSTADNVSQISGRGVGMDAVRTFLQENGGTIKLQLYSTLASEFVPFETIIRIPRSMFLQVS